MQRSAALAIRFGVLAAASGIMVTGIVFAAHGDNAAPSAEGATPLALIAPTEEPVTPIPTPPAPATTAAVPSSSTPTATTSDEQPATTPGVSPTPPPSPSPAALTAVSTAEAPTPPAVTQAPATAAPPEATPTPEPITDLPKYTDLQVLALAANAILPSGRTFANCVGLPPDGEAWPRPVHLYYLGKGKWRVETHLGEIGVIFDEATATFRTAAFAPPNSACLTPP